MRKSSDTRWPRHPDDSGPPRRRRKTAVRTAVCLLALAAATAGAAWGQPPPRQVVVMGDLHLGPGRDASGRWRPGEDFRWADELGRFLTALDGEAGPTGIDLILNGDTFALGESTAAACANPEPGLGCTEDEALAQVTQVLAAHADEVTALAAFARSGTNRVVLVPGDHDAALLFPRVQRQVLSAFGASDGRVAVAAGGSWSSADGRIHVEHGHQIGNRPSRFEGWPTPFVERAGRRHLYRPPGAAAVDELTRAWEPVFPTIDSFAEVGEAVRFGFAADGTTDLGPAVARHLRYLLFRMPWQQFRVDLDAGDVQPPVWDLAAVRRQGPSFLVEALPDDDRFKPLAERGLADGHLDALMTSLGDAELMAVCDYRAALRRARRRFERYVTQNDPRGPPVAECPRPPSSRGGQFDYFWRSRDDTYARRIQAIEAARPTPLAPVAIFVHGHTHLVDWRQRVLEQTRLGREVIVDGFSPVRNALRPVVVNGGAWQRTITPVEFDRLREAHGLTDEALLRRLRPEDLAPCYSFVQIEPYDDGPDAPAVRYWRQSEAGIWELAPSCGRQPRRPAA